MAIAAGMDCAICDPCEKGLRNSIYSAHLVAGQDPDCLRYNNAFRNGLIGPAASSATNHAMVADAFWKLSTALIGAGIIDSGAIPEAMPSLPAPQEAPAGNQRAAVEELADALVQMQKVRVAELVRTLLETNADPLEIPEASKGAMSEVGRLFETQEYFIPELILAGAMLKDISEAVKPYLHGAGGGSKKKGRVIIGTVQGDIHDIGKDIVVTMLEVNGYEVMDLGVDVPPSRFIEAAREYKPQVIGLSGFLTLAYDPMKETIAALKAENMGAIKVMIGGGQIDDQVMSYTGADGWGLDAIAAINFCNQWIA
jgi:methanogenic corrinoid protein MtbC1